MKVELRGGSERDRKRERESCGCDAGDDVNNDNGIIQPVYPATAKTLKWLQQGEKVLPLCAESGSIGWSLKRSYLWLECRHQLVLLDCQQ